MDFFFLFMDSDCWEYREETIVTVKVLNQNDSAETKVAKDDNHHCTCEKRHRKWAGEVDNKRGEQSFT